MMKQSPEGYSTRRKYSKRLAGLVFSIGFTLSVGFVPPAFAVPTEFAGTGNFYEFIVAPDITWTDANTAAQGSSFLGSTGQLVTIFSQAENDFVLSLLGGIANSVWLGASDAGTEGDWLWVTGEQFWQGDAGGSAVGGLYNNWNGGEPNDFSAGEDYLSMFGQNSSAPFAPGFWNDLPLGGGTSSPFFIAGYVVEYEDVQQPIPEPSTIFLFGTGIAGLIAWRRKFHCQV